MSQSDRRPCSTALPLLCSVAILCACGVQSDSKVESPILVLVNDRPITLSQLDRLIRAAEPVAPAQAIESLVNEELLVQDAEKQQIDHDPAVVQEIEASRRQILARACIERNLHSKEEVSASEVQEFYRANPILFEKRKRFSLKDFFFEGSSLDQPLTEALENVHSDSDLRELLNKRSIRYSAQADSISADQLPLDKLAEFEHASVGDVMTAHQGRSTTMIMLITGIQDDTSLPFDLARPYIEAYLSKMRSQQALSECLKRAKAGAKIVYSDDGRAASLGVMPYDRLVSVEADKVLR
jgi:EpsD family peptidyl-prolyl cis-trans isomerase